MMLINGSLIEQHSFVVAVILHELLLSPLRTRLLILKIVQVNFPLQVTLHFQLYGFERIKKRDFIGRTTIMLLHWLKKLPKPVQSFNHY